MNWQLQVFVYNWFDFVLLDPAFYIVIRGYHDNFSNSALHHRVLMIIILVFVIGRQFSSLVYPELSTYMVN